MAGTERKSLPSSASSDTWLFRRGGPGFQRYWRVAVTQVPEVPGSVAVGFLTLLSNGDALTAAVPAGARHPPGLLTT